MNTENPFAHINLDRPVRHQPPRLVPVVILLVMAILLWVILPDPVAYFLQTLLLMLNAWVATYGLEEATDDLIRFLKRLKNLF